MKEILNKIKSVLFYLIVGIIVIFIFFEIFIPKTTIKVFGFKSFVVVTQSMEPEIDVFDVVVDKNFDVEELEVGDIITFSVDKDYDGELDIVTHYIAQVIEDPATGAISFKTHRHFENVDDLYNDPWTISSSDVLGEYWFQIPKLGYVIEFIKSPFGIGIIFLNIVLIVGVVYLIKKKDPEEELEQETEVEKSVEEKEEKEVEVQKEESPEKVSKQKDYSKMTVAELKTLCKLYSIPGYSKLKKAELIEALEKHL